MAIQLDLFPWSPRYEKRVYVASCDVWFRYKKIGRKGSILFHTVQWPWTPVQSRRHRRWLHIDAFEITRIQKLIGYAKRTVREEIFVGEKFRTFPLIPFRMEFKFVLSERPKRVKTIEWPANKVEENLEWKFFRTFFKYTKAMKLNSLRKFLLLQ